MIDEDLATGGDQPETTSAPAAAPVEKAEASAEEVKTSETVTGEGKQPDPVKDPAKETEAASEAAKALQKRKQTMQERLNEVSFERRKAELRAEQAERELADLRGKLKAPNPDEYTDPAKLTADQINYTMDQRDVRRLETERATATKQAEEARAVVWHERAEAFKAENPDVDFDKIAQEARFSEPTSMMIADMEEGPAVLVHLQGNRAEIRRIEGLPERQRAFALGKIAERITATPPKRVTSAPQPVSAVTGKAAGSSESPADMDMNQYVHWRKKGGGGGRR